VATLQHVDPKPPANPDRSPAAGVVTDSPRKFDRTRTVLTVVERPWQHYWHVHQPLKTTLTELLDGVPPRKLVIEPDRSKTVVGLHRTFTGDDRLRQAIERAVCDKLDIKDLKPTWDMAGRRPQLTLIRVTPPPDRVTLATRCIRDGVEATILEHIKAAQWHENIWGVGEYAQLVATSIDTESPHTGLSQPSGAGKSIDGRSSLAQMLHHGAIGVVLDYKKMSQKWAEGLPNVAYCKTPAQIHKMLMWLAGGDKGGEIGRRNDVADTSADVEGRVTANVGPPIFVLVEELNATQRALDRYYKKYVRGKGDPLRSPAADALDEGLFIGRQVRVFLYLICQRGSVKAVSGSGGGGDARDNIGVWAMYDPSPATFRMIGWDHELPPATGHKGRKQIVTAQWVKESQNIFMSGAEARALATAGVRGVARSDMPFIPRPDGTVPDDPDDDRPAIEAGQGPDTRVKGTPGPPPGITLDDAVAAGIFGRRSVGAVKKKFQRDDDAPSPVLAGYPGGPAHRYDELALRDYASGLRQ
jgi:hypothetical protein